MKKITIGVFVLLFLNSCANKKKETDSYVPEKAYHSTDSIAQVPPSDSLFTETKEQEKEEMKPIMPVEKNELFDDFIYNFTTDEEFQQQRIVFPVPYYNLNVSSKIEKEDWKHDELFIKNSYYTLFFDTEEDMELSKESSLTSVQVEWNLMKSRTIKKYYFERIKGAWMLEAINIHAGEKNKNESFLDFFIRFSTDTLFQHTRIREPLTFITTDPDDDFSIMETTLDLNQWSAFRPDLPVDDMFYISYGQQNSNQSTHKIVALKGIENGFSNYLYFRRRDNKWQLYKFEDTGN